jgi:V/A-type H+-transporting ATPase subunit I
MIAQLKKFTFLVYHREYNELLDMLREAGVVHIIDKGRGTEEDPAAELIAQLRRYDNVIRVVKRSLPEDDKVSPPQIPPETEPEEVIATVENLLSESEELKSRIQALKSEAAKIEAWGEYEQADFEKLLKTGWQISLFTCPSKRFSQEWHNRYSIQVINVDRGKTYFAVVHKPGGY